MGLRAASFFAFSVCIAFTHGSSAPKILIIPFKKSVASPAPSVSIGNYLAQALDQDGRLTPIVWSLTDPLFRSAATSGQLGSVTDYPTRAQSMANAKSFGATYVLLYSEQTAEHGIQAHADLYENGKEIWHDSVNSGSSHGSTVSGQDTSASIAHTWELQLTNSVFKHLVSRPKVATPGLQKGLSPPAVIASPLAPPDTATAVTIKADELRKAGKIEKAITLVRDSIDADPFNPKLRMLVIDLYEQQKNWDAAADAARRATEVIPDNLDLRKATLKDLIAAGKRAEAAEQLNEIVARDPRSAESLLLQGQTHLLLGNPEKALAKLDDLAKLAPSPSTYYWRALGRAAAGGADGVNSDIQQYLKKPFADQAGESLCCESEAILAECTKRDVALALSLYQQASVHPESGAVKDQLELLLNRANARSNFLQQIRSSKRYSDSNDSLLLAQKLLLVSYVSMQDVLKNGGEDSVTEARINLGEAIKTLKNSQQQLAAEKGESSSVAVFVASN